MKAVDAGQALGRVMVDEFIRCGMRHACLSPGSRSTPFALALAGRPEINLHVLIDERSAAFLALGIARQSGRPVAMLTTSGTAAANLLPAVIEADHSGVPLLLLTADRPPALRDTGAGQTVDQLKLFGAFVRWFAEAGVAEARPESNAYWRSIACRGYYTATGVRPGPVHLNLAFRDPLVPNIHAEPYPYSLEGRPGEAPWAQVHSEPPGISDQEAACLARAIEESHRGLIVVGAGVFDPGGLIALAQSAGWPLLAEPASNARYGPTAISLYEALLRSTEFAESHRPDFVLRVGSLGTSPSLNSFLDSSVVQAAVDPGGTWRDPRRASRVFYQASVEQLCQRVNSLLAPRHSTDWLRDWLDAEAKSRRAVDGFLDEVSEITEPGLARDLADLLAGGSELVVASSMPVRDLDWFMRPRRGLKIHVNRGANGIDGFVSTALGVALSSKNPTVALCGDLSLLYDQNGLMLGLGEEVSAVFVVINNNGGGIFNFLPQAQDPHHFERLFGTPHNIDLACLAQTYRCEHALIEKPNDIGPLLTQAQNQGGIHILEAKTDRRKNVETHRQLWQLVAAALER